MTITVGFNHVATNTADLDRVMQFYRDAFGAEVSFETAATDHHPRMAVIELGAGAALNVFEVPADSIVGDRRTMGARGAIDHFALAAWSLFFRDPDGMELEVCAPGTATDTG